MYLPNPSITGRIQHKVNFQQSKASLNSEFSFQTDYVTKAKKSSLLYSLLIAGREAFFPKGISTKWNASRIVQDLNSVRRFHFENLKAKRTVLIDVF